LKLNTQMLNQKEYLNLSPHNTAKSYQNLLFVHHLTSQNYQQILLLINPSIFILLHNKGPLRHRKFHLLINIFFNIDINIFFIIIQSYFKLSCPVFSLSRIKKTLEINLYLCSFKGSLRAIMNS